jgi:preprotein translocase subunit SecG
MKAILHSFLLKLKRQPPFAAAFLTIFIYTCPVLVSIITAGSILLPSGYTSTLVVKPIYGIIAILIDVILLSIFGFTPIFKTHFLSIITPDFVRKLLIYGYMLLTFVSLYIINAKLDFINSLLADPVITMLKAGASLGDGNLLRYFFYGISGCIAFALIKKDDSFFLRSLGFICMLSIVLFYFFIGRREICVMAICILFFLKREKISSAYMLIIGIVIAAVLVFVLSLRSGDDSGSMFSTNSEELSPVAYSAYIVQKTTPDVLGSFTGATILRAYLIPNDISVAFFMTDAGYSDPATPVLGIGGITYMYGFIIPFITVFILGCFCNTVSFEYQKTKSAVIKLLLIYLVFRAFNLFRTGEFPLVTLDTLKFFILMLPALYLRFESKKPQPFLN